AAVAGRCWAGLARSLVGGQTWTVAQGLPFPFPVVALSQDRGSPAVLYAGTHGAPGLLKSTDGGATWQAARTGIPDAYPAAMALASTAPGTVYAGVATAFPPIGGAEGGAVFRSPDRRGAGGRP